MEKTLGFVAWNYSKKPFNINGRVCLTYSIFWGILGSIWIKLICPRVKKIIDKFNKIISNKFMIAMIVFLIFNTLLTFAALKEEKNSNKAFRHQINLNEY
jgi:uncharacterized membrane protein